MSILKKSTQGICGAALLAAFFAACSGDNTVITSTTELPPSTSEDINDSTNNGESESEIQEILFDDFEDGDNQTSLGQYWFWYNDNTSKAKSTISTPKGSGKDDLVPSSTDNGSKMALHLKYTLDQGEYQYDPFVGWGATVGSSVDCSKIVAVKYRYKGSAHTVRAEISSIKDSDHYFYSVPKSDTWKEITVSLTDMAQEGWGEAKPFNPSEITTISFQKKGPNESGEILIDDIYLLSSPNGATLPPSAEEQEKVADMKIRDAVLPSVKVGEIAITNPLQATAMKYLDKGVNFTNWLEEDRAFNGTFKFGEKDVKLMAQSGLKALRFPIDLDKYATNRDDYVSGKADILEFDDKNLFTVLDSFYVWTKQNGMSLTIDYHEYDNSYNATNAAKPRYVTMMACVWKHVAEHFADSTREDLFFELLNEPDMKSGMVSSASWRAAAKEIIDSIRTIDKDRLIIFGDAEWYSIEKLAAGAPLEDDKIIYAVHTYDPFEFTHQGASWSETKTLKNIMFPYDKSKWTEYSVDFGVTAQTPTWVASNVKNYYKRGSKEFIMSVVYPAKEWAVKNNVPVIINEFGALNTTGDAKSVLNYMNALREISEELKIPLQHWGYTGQFALFKSGALIEGMDKAFGITPKAP